MTAKKMKMWVGSRGRHVLRRYLPLNENFYLKCYSIREVQLNSGLLVRQSCIPELVRPQLHPLDLHEFLHNEGLLSIFLFISLTISSGTYNYVFPFVLTSYLLLTYFFFLL
jgi:hypothetical protein